MTEEMCVVDTNVVSYIFRRDSRGAAYGRILSGFWRRMLSFQTVAELEFWARKRHWGSRRRDELSEYLENFDVIHSDDAICSRWVHARMEMEEVGSPIHVSDAWIAAVALEFGCPLVTHNAAHFRGIAGLDVRTLESGI